MISKSTTLSFKSIGFIRTTVDQAMSIVKYLDRNELGTVWLRKVVDLKNFKKYRKELKNVETSDDGKDIEFKLPNPTQFFRNLFMKFAQGQTKEIQAEPSLKEVSVRSVFESQLPMQSILRHLQCFDIEKLRKVNREIRDCVALIKPNPHIEKYSICFDLGFNHGIFRTFVELENGKFKDVEYCSFDNRVYLSERFPLLGKNDTSFLASLPGTDNEVICLNDVERTLNYQEECIKELVICYQCTDLFSGNFESFLDTDVLPRRIGDILRRRKNPLKTRKFSMGSGSQMEMMKILPAIDSNSLKIIEFLFPSTSKYESGIELPFQVDQLSETPQWNNAEHLISKYLTLTRPIQDMNTNLLNSSEFRKFKISFRDTTIDETLHTLIGEPYRNLSNVKRVWYFHILATDDYMHIVLKTPENTQSFKPKSITFAQVDKEDTPFF